MPAELNQVFLLGNLTRDPEIRYLESGTAVTKLGLAVNRSYTDRSGERRDEPCFVNIDTWERLAETCHQYLKKGSKVLVQGRLTFRQWETDAGERRSVHEIRAMSVQFLDRPDTDGGGDDGGRSSVSAPAGGGAQSDSEEDDIPF